MIDEVDCKHTWFGFFAEELLQQATCMVV